eukprot:6459573-Ditylum_brightwellii.AAC.1
MKGGTTAGTNVPRFSGELEGVPIISLGQPNRSLNHQMIPSQQSALSLDLSFRAQVGQLSPTINPNLSHRPS